MPSKQEIREYFAKFGRQGGRKRAQNMTPEQRSEAARRAVRARWAKIDSSLKEVRKNLDALRRKQRETERARQKSPRPKMTNP